MKKRAFSDKEIVSILTEFENGTDIDVLASQHDVTPSTILRWRGKYGSADLTAVSRLRELEVQNQKLRHIVEKQAKEIQNLKLFIKQLQEQ